MIKLKNHKMFDVIENKVYESVSLHDIAENRETEVGKYLGEKNYKYFSDSIKGMLEEYRNVKTRLYTNSPDIVVKKIETVPEVAEHRDRYYEIIFAINHNDVENGKRFYRHSDISYEICKLTDKDDDGKITGVTEGCYILSKAIRPLDEEPEKD